jgi:hypothetical protein
MSGETTATFDDDTLNKLVEFLAGKSVIRF